MITDEMVERAARRLFALRARRSRTWQAVIAEEQELWRSEAREILQAALTEAAVQGAYADGRD